MNFSEKIFILDGAMGTMLQRYNAVETIGDLCNITHPEVIGSIHKAYIDAGADIIETNTFNSNAISLSEYGLAGKAYELNFQGAQIAREAADNSSKRVYVAGSMGPTSKMLSLSNDINRPQERSCSFDEMADAYYTQALGLIDGGVDYFLVETIFDSLNAKAALYAITKACEERNKKIKTMVSATANDRYGRLLTGQELEAFYYTIKDYDIISFGLNCSFGAKEMQPIVESYSEKFACAFSIYPNAGLPNELGEYDQRPEDAAEAIKSIAEKGLINIVGGCCGTTPEHIKAIAEAVKGLKPREIPSEGKKGLTVTGTTTVSIDKNQYNFINVGERTNVAGSRKFAKLIAESQYEEAAAVAKKQIADGASIIDINMDDAMLDSAKEMETFVRYIENDPDIARVALMIDSSDWKTILAGLKNAPGKSIVNSISLKEGEKEFISKAKEIKALGAAVIVMAFDEDGQATTYDRKIEICERAYRLLIEQAGFSPENIIFDVNILTIGTGMAEHADYAVDYINAVKWIKENLPGVHTSGGVSNISFAFRGNNPVREAMHSVFLYHAINAGLDMAIVNPSMLQIYDNIEPELLSAVEDVVLNSDEKATERLIALAEKLKSVDTVSEINEKTEAWRTESLEQRFAYALTKGVSDYLEADLNEALECNSAIEIIEGPLLRGMDTVGKLFSEGKMFLPQVIKSAKVMRNAVDYLQPYIRQGESSTVIKKKMVLATAKGDVHDIGKNILSVVLSCNNIEVIDLGVMVDNKDIIEAAVANDADFIGISGLITPSLKYMEELCEELEARQLSIPLFVGGATASMLHTSVKLAPKYNGDVFYTTNASECAIRINQFIQDPVSTRRSNSAEQDKIAEIYRNRQETIVSIEQARELAPIYEENSFIQPAEFGTTDYFNPDIEAVEFIDRIDWQMFLAFWGFKGKLAELSKNNVEAVKILDEGREKLSEMIHEKSVIVSASLKFFDAHRDGDSIVINQSGKRFNVGRGVSDLSGYQSLADFFMADRTTKIGIFAIKVEDRHHCCDCCHKDFDHLLRASLCQRLAEAASQWLTESFSCGENFIRPAFGYPSCPDHSLKKTAFELLDAEKTLGIKLTESYAMIPTSSICGMLILHKNAKYINVTSNRQ